MWPAPLDYGFVDRRGLICTSARDLAASRPGASTVWQRGQSAVPSGNDPVLLEPVIEVKATVEHREDVEVPIRRYSAYSELRRCLAGGSLRKVENW